MLTDILYPYLKNKLEYHPESPPNVVKDAHVSEKSHELVIPVKIHQLKKIEEISLFILQNERRM